MSDKDLASNIKVLPSIAVTAIATNTTTTGAIIDTKGYGSLAFAIAATTYTDGVFTPLVHEGDAANLSDAAVVTSSNVFGDGIVNTQNTIKDISVRLGTKRYVRLSLVSTGVTSGGSFSAIAILGNPDLSPA